MLSSLGKEPINVMTDIMQHRFDIKALHGSTQLPPILHSKNYFDLRRRLNDSIQILEAVSCRQEDIASDL